MQKLKQAKDLSILADSEFKSEHFQKAVTRYNDIIEILTSLLHEPLHQNILVDLKEKIEKYENLKKEAQNKLKPKEQIPINQNPNQPLLDEGEHQKKPTSIKNPNNKKEDHKSSQKGKAELNNGKRNTSQQKVAEKKQTAPKKPQIPCIHGGEIPRPTAIDRKKDKPKDVPLQPEVKDLIIRNIKVSFKDIVGLKDVISMLKEAVIRPGKRPDLYTGIRAPPRGLLLYGPPGNGKTLVCSALANQSQCTFFSLSASSIMNKYLGQSQKMVKKVFAAAAQKAPSIIFIDEIDSMLTARSEKQHQASRRLKTEFLVLMDGISSPKSGDLIVIGATNLPKQLDPAAKRRFSKFIYIGNPDPAAREQLLLRNLKGIQYQLTEQEIKIIVEKLDCYSASEIKNIMVQVCNQPLREVTESKFCNITNDQLRKVCLKDFMIVLQDRKPIMSREQLQKYKQKV